MGKFILRRRFGDDGLSLVEVLASTVILTLLLTTFLMVFIQSAKVNKVSEHIINATYIAQMEMEKIYGLSTSTINSEKEVQIIRLGYSKQANENGWTVFEKPGESPNSLVKLKILTKRPMMDRILIEVHDGTSHKLQVQMESVVVWRID